MNKLLALMLIAVVHPLVAQIYTSCDRWGNITTNGYTVYNNIWGSGYGSQCLTVNAYNNWYVDASHSGNGIKSYPNVERRVNYNVDSMPAISSTFGVNRPGGGSYNTAYDIWYNNYDYEIMLWMNWNGGMKPIAYNWDASGNPIPEYRNVSIGGHTWNVYRGSNGSNYVFSFLRTSHTNSGTVDITAISKWLRNVGWFGNVNLHSIQFGFEITSTSGTQRFATTNFSVTEGGGGGGGGAAIPASATAAPISTWTVWAGQPMAPTWDNTPTPAAPTRSGPRSGPAATSSSVIAGPASISMAWDTPLTVPYVVSGATAAATTSSGRRRASVAGTTSSGIERLVSASTAWAARPTAPTWAIRQRRQLQSAVLESRSVGA
jgi:hypothetical protein